jgi:hypothetical protein
MAAIWVINDYEGLQWWIYGFICASKWQCNMNEGVSQWHSTLDLFVFGRCQPFDPGFLMSFCFTLREILEQYFNTKERNAFDRLEWSKTKGYNVLEHMRRAMKRFYTISETITENWGEKLKKLKNSTVQTREFTMLLQNVKKNYLIKELYERRLKTSWTSSSAPLLCRRRRWLLRQVVVVGVT